MPSSFAGSGQIVDDDPGLDVHLLPVLDHLPDVAQHVVQVLLDLGQLGRIGLPVDLDMHPRLTQHVRGPVGIGRLGLAHL